ncbi:MAG TPA: M90 family metallopeptidase [Vicinamibacteria bacterium]|nr:M90 family metallopeptidase [Vicinamibacteria bacterium]
MRPERPHDRRFARIAGVSAAGLGSALGALVGGWSGAGLGLAGGALAGLGLRRAMLARTARRRAALAAPLPARLRAFLLESYDHYERMDPAWRARFEDDVRLFLAETRITGIGIEATDELRLLVAASAVTLSVGWPEYEWDQLTEVLLYPDDFDRDYAFGGDERSGETHPWGTVILSVPSLHESFEVPDDAYHVGIHEFAHLLDVDQTHFDGIPVGLSRDQAREWVAVAEKEMERLRHGRSAFDDYGAHDPVEFLGVAVEAFFEIPQRVRRRHPEVYAILSEYFRQDPAAWDDARGIRE